MASAVISDPAANHDVHLHFKCCSGSGKGSDARVGNRAFSAFSLSADSGKKRTGESMARVAVVLRVGGDVLECQLGWRHNCLLLTE